MNKFRSSLHKSAVSWVSLCLGASGKILGHLFDTSCYFFLHRVTVFLTATLRYTKAYTAPQTKKQRGFVKIIKPAVQLVQSASAGPEPDGSKAYLVSMNPCKNS